MQAAQSIRSEKLQEKLLVVQNQKIVSTKIESLLQFFKPGDLLVVNDAATLPASFMARTVDDKAVEIRLAARLEDGLWQAVLFGEGNWRTPTENRALPPLDLGVGSQLNIDDSFFAEIVKVAPFSKQWVEIQFNLEGPDLWPKIYQQGRLIQYSYLREDLPLWSAQNIYSSRPWAFEMPSAGHIFTWELLLKIFSKGIDLRTLTHAAGISSTGAGELDQRLPGIERFEIPVETWQAVEQTKKRGGRVIAVGTSVVRALESQALGKVGSTDLIIDKKFELRIADAILTGTHDVTETHYMLTQAFQNSELLKKANKVLEEQNFLTHEFGDSCLIFKS